MSEGSLFGAPSVVSETKPSKRITWGITIIVGVVLIFVVWHVWQAISTVVASDTTPSIYPGDVYSGLSGSWTYHINQTTTVALLNKCIDGNNTLSIGSVSHSTGWPCWKKWTAGDLAAGVRVLRKKLIDSGVNEKSNEIKTLDFFLEGMGM